MPGPGGCAWPGGAWSRGSFNVMKSVFFLINYNYAT